MPRTSYWWKGVPNFGDRLNGLLQLKLGLSPHWSPIAEADLIMVGSVLDQIPRGYKGTVCGAGLLKPGSRVDLSEANVLALRGKLSQAHVTGVSKAIALGDPGLLISKVHPQLPTPKYDLGIVPHWSDTQLAKRYPHGKLIDVRQHPEVVVAQIAACRRIISSSLHGIIVADSYGIPRQAELFERAAKEGGDFKFRDYTSVFGETPRFGEMYKLPHHKLEKVQNRLWEALLEALEQPPTKVAPPPHRPIYRSKCAPQISLLVPFRDDGEHRSRVWDWLRKFWSFHLRSVEIIQGHDSGYPFSKSAAINEAASRARGRVFVILDADTYMDPLDIQECADRIDSAVRHRKRLWFIPYTKLFRLTEEFTLDLLRDKPWNGFWLPSCPQDEWLEPGRSEDYGHKFGAMVQVMPREAFFAAGGMDPRFRGWGSEDSAMMRAVDTLYAPHELFHTNTFHMWHERPGNAKANTRKWIGQTGASNSRLAHRYGVATGELGYMYHITREHVQPKDTWKLLSHRLFPRGN